MGMYMMAGKTDEWVFKPVLFSLSTDTYSVSSVLLLIISFYLLSICPVAVVCVLTFTNDF